MQPVGDAVRWRVPLLSEFGTYKTVTARFWPWPSGKSPQSLFNGSHCLRQLNGTPELGIASLPAACEEGHQNLGRHASGYKSQLNLKKWFQFPYEWWRGDKASGWRGCAETSRARGGVLRYRGTSLMTCTPLPGPYSRTKPRVLWWPYKGRLLLMSEVPL